MAWPYLANMLPLLELMRAKGFEPADEDYTPRAPDMPTVASIFRKKSAKLSSIFIWRAPREEALEEILEKAILLGRKARDEEWTKEQLKIKFNLFVKTEGNKAKSLGIDD